MAPTTGRPKLIVFKSSHGGTGQTALSTHVALGLARSGLSVLFVELQVPSVATHYLRGEAAAGSAAPSMLDNLVGDARQVESRLWHISVDTSNTSPRDALSRLAMSELPRGLWVIVDLPRNLDARSDLALDPDIQVHVLRADPASLIDTSALAEREDSVILVLNQIDHRRPISRAIDQVLGTLLEDRQTVRVHYDEAIAESLALRTNVFDSAPGSSAARQLTGLVDLLMAADASQTPIVASPIAD